MAALRAGRRAWLAAIAVAQANLEVSRAELAKVQDMLDRLKSVTDQRAISQDDLRNRSNDVAKISITVPAGDELTERQVEILRGPQAGAFGANAAGGIVSGTYVSNYNGTNLGPITTDGRTLKTNYNVATT